MALNRKYAALPDLDSAPDIYETPELTDDNSTIPTTARAHSDDEFGEFGDDEGHGISRNGLSVEEARRRFSPHNADFSERVDGKRRSYRATGLRQRGLQGEQNIGDFSDEEEEESLERRIARLNREVQEAKEEYAKRQAGQGADDETDLKLSSLSKALDELSQPQGFVITQRSTSPPPPPTTEEKAPVSSGENGTTFSITYAPRYEQTHALAKAADFDRRLLILEKALGLHSSSLSEAGESGLPRAILPTLDSMEKQISTLSQASITNLDAISRRVRTLAADQEKLNESRKNEQVVREELGKHAGPLVPDDSEQEAKINALYAILPTIETLTPMLPPLLDRLRSLRAIHGDAANASQILDEVEKQQTEMGAEIKQWKEGLEKLEETIKAGDETMKKNMGTMEGWVRGIEQRMDTLK